MVERSYFLSAYSGRRQQSQGEMHVIPRSAAHKERKVMRAVQDQRLPLCVKRVISFGR